MSISLTELFPGATQNATSLTLDKGFMSAYGLVATSSNNPEAMVLCIIARCAEILTESRRANNRTTQRVAITFAGQDAIEDVPGSGEYVNRLVYSAINYNPITLGDLDVSSFD
jgi:hypothetical protein